MADVFDYLYWRGDLKIRSDKFNDVDALILSRLSYLQFDNIVGNSFSEKITIKQAAKLFFDKKDYSELLLWKGDDKLLREVADSKRFGNMKLSGYCNIVESDKQMQFSAIAIEVSKDLTFISFRGTDNTLVGWQEDFNMFCMFPLPSQEKAVDYVKRAAGYFDGKLILGGHSKGGNLAVYAAAFSKAEIRDRIITIYNQDGPGFDKKTLSTSGFAAIKNKTITNVPQSSIFGMMFEHEEDFTIVKSNQKGFMQHDIYSWEIDRTSLVRLSHTTNLSVFFDHTLTQFAAGMTEKERKEFTEGVFYLLNSTENTTFNQIKQNIISNSGTILSSVKNLDSETRSLILSSVLNFIKCAKNNFSDINPLSKENRISREKDKSLKKSNKQK